MNLSVIRAAREGLRATLPPTPLAWPESLRRPGGARIGLKLENLQMTGSFKERGALWKLLHLTGPQRRRGVITASAGNHAQAVAYHARRLRIACRVVMPAATPLIKVTSVARHGAAIVLHGASFDAAVTHARGLQRRSGAVYVHGYDDPLVIAGQGTLGLELLEEAPDLNAVVVPVGGGGLIAGVAAAIKALRPRVKVWGVRPASLDTLADGIAVKALGVRTRVLVRRLVDGIVTVGDDEIASAILLLAEREKTIAEGAGAAALAAILAGRIRTRGRVVALVSGGNLDMNLLSRIIERGLARDGRRQRLRVELPDVPGGLHRMIGEIAALRGNILDVRHDRAFIHGRVGTTAVDVILETRGRDHIRAITRRLTRAGYAVRPG